jgi:hypothetical protein
MTPNFKPMPRLYLELLENKNKVLPDLRKKEFISPSGGGTFQAPSLRDAKDEAQKTLSDELKMRFIDEQENSYLSRHNKDFDKDSKSRDSSLKIIDFSSDDRDKSKEKFSLSKDDRNSPRKDSNEDDIIGHMKGSIKSSFRDKYSKRDKKYEIGDGSPRTRELDDRDSSNRSEERSSKYYGSDSRSKDDYDDYRSSERYSGRDSDRGRSESSSENKKSESRKNNDPLSKLLSGDLNNEPSQQGNNLKQDSYQTYTNGVPPSLDEINSGKVHMDSNGVRDIEYTTQNEESELQQKRDILYKFNTLRRSYKHAKIPEYTEYTDLKTLKREYEMITKQIKIDLAAEKYKKILLFLFFGLEYVLRNFLKFQDIAGFAQEQMVKINDYESILLEIGEKHYVSESKQWPAELRLLGVVAMNAAMFVLPKVLLKAAGGSNIFSGIGDLMNGISSEKSNPSQQTSNPSQKTKLRGPDIDIEDLTDKKFN